MFRFSTLFNTEANTAILSRSGYENYHDNSAKEIQNVLAHDHLDGYWEWNVGSSALFLSSSFKDWLGYQEFFLPHDVALWDQLIFEEDRSRFHLQIEATVRSQLGTIAPFEVRIREMSGSYRWAKCQLKCVDRLEALGRTVIGSFIDITSYKVSAQELAFKNQETQHFAYVVSHDLQAPLRNLESLAMLLDKEYRSSLDDDANFYLDQMVNSTGRMKSLITGLLEFSRIDQKVHKEEVDCENILNGVLDDLAIQIKESEAIIDLDFLPTVLGHECHLRSLFQNLIENALKFSAPNQKPEIEVSCEVGEAEFVFSVTDKGQGIREEDREKVFMMFKRCQRQMPGYGIGLAHCKKIVEMHGGRIWVDASFKNGSRFSFTIPKEEL